MPQLLALVALLFSLADHWTTYLCLRAPVEGWNVMEANPLSQWLFAELGLVEGLLLDSVVTVGALIFLLTTRRMAEGSKLLFLGVVIAATGYAVVNNLEAIYQLGLSPLGMPA